jgi:hypothetical protein
VALQAEPAELSVRAPSQDAVAPGNSGAQVAELRREVEALRRDRDLTQQLLVVADTEAAELRAALHAAEQNAQNAARAAAEAETDMMLAREQYARLPAEEASVEVSQLLDEMSDILEVALRDRVADTTTIALLERATRLTRGDPRVARVLGRLYLDLGRPGDAIQTLTSQAEVPLSPVSAALVVEAYLADHRVPEPALLERTQWEASRAADLLTSADWLAPDQVVALAPALADNPFPRLGAWFARMAEDLSGDALGRLLDAWREHDAPEAARYLFAALDRQKTPAKGTWVVDGLRRALELSDESVVGKSIAALIDIARQSGAVSQLDELVSVWRRRLTGRERLVTGVRLAIAQADLRAGAEPDQDEAQLLVDLYWESKRQGDQANLEEISALVERTMATANPSLRALLKQCRQPNLGRPAGPAQPVSSVFEAVEYVRQQYPELVVLPEAVESARQRGTAGTKAALKSLEALGEVARDYATDDLSTSVREACRSLPGFREDISDPARQQFRRDYERRLPDGRTITLGPHINGGLKDGRIYFFIDEEDRRIVIGHIGKHLRGARDS